eukprot:c8836_g1_i2.p2 GENE.c8836_g1_i2~~c8836_g1_i2.p2  ORF type:complete len:241 (+),score=34.59 c8836_g1_i2:223-945(+)
MGGADRIEVCADLHAGGTTPSIGLVSTIVAARAELLAHRLIAPCLVFVLVRARGGDFLYSDDEMATMVADIEALCRLPVDGFVLGALTPDGSVDVERTRALVAAADGARQFTFHRAIDMARDIDDALVAVASISQISRVLSSGGAASALEGAAVLRRLHERARLREPPLTVVAGGGLSAQNARALVDASGVREVHGSLRAAVPSAMEHRGVARMGAAPEFQVLATSEGAVRATRAALDER